MKLFQCQYCRRLLYFENSRCERCGHPLGYLPELAELSALEPDGGGACVPLARPEDRAGYARTRARAPAIG